MIITEDLLGLDLIGSTKAAEILNSVAADVKRFRDTGRLQTFKIDNYFLFDRKEVEALAALVFARRERVSDKAQKAADLREAKERARGKKEGDISLNAYDAATYWHLIQVGSRWGANKIETEKILLHRGTQIYFHKGERYILRSEFSPLSENDKKILTCS